MEKNKIFTIQTNNVNIEKLNERSNSLLGLFTSKTRKEVIDLKIYKSLFIFGLSDTTLVTYDIVREKQIVEINELAGKGIQDLSQLEILHQIENVNKEDIILCLCGKNLVFFDLDQYQIR
jgi:tRNA 2-selenouridine synthase SelU